MNQSQVQMMPVSAWKIQIFPLLLQTWVRSNWIIQLNKKSSAKLNRPIVCKILEQL